MMDKLAWVNILRLLFFLCWASLLTIDLNGWPLIASLFFSQTEHLEILIGFA